MDRISHLAGHLAPPATCHFKPDGPISDRPLRVLITGAAGQIAYSLVG